MGSLAVHQDLILWSLKSQITEDVCILQERLGHGLQNHHQREMQASLAELTEEMRRKISCRPIHWLAGDVAQRQSWIGLGKSSECCDWAMVRDSCVRRFPICGIIHSALFPGILNSFMSLHMHFLPGDVLVATSKHAKRATESIIDQASLLVLRAFPQLSAQNLPKLRIEHLPLGIDDIWLDPLDKAVARSILSLDPEIPVILYLGRISREYKADLEPLIRAMRSVKQEFPSVQLLIAGSTVHAPSTSDLDRIIHEFGLGANVRVLANFPRALKKVLLSAADVFISPVDNIQESFGISILEAMAAGLPVIASDWSGYKELVSHGKTGFLVETCIDPSVWSEADQLAALAFPPQVEHCIAQRTVVDVNQLTERMRNLLGNTELRTRFGSAGQQRVKDEFLWSKVIQNFGLLWKEQAARFKGSAVDSSTLDTRRAFEQYATSNGNGMALVRAEPEASEEYAKRFPHDPAGCALLEMCGQSPHLLSELVKRSSPGRVYHFLKKGLLRKIVQVNGLPMRRG